MLPEGNGSISSPRRTLQRLALLDNSPVPDGLPKGGEKDRPGTASVHWSPATVGGSFPFQAKPGASGPAPTNELLAGGVTPDASPHAITRVRTNPSDTATPPGRRSVQFARGPVDEEPASLQRSATWDTDHEKDEDVPAKQRQGSFFGKLKALASPTSSTYHSRSQSNSTGFVTPAFVLSPQSERSEPSYPVEPSEAAEQADVEDSDEQADAVHDLQPKKRRKSKRPVLTAAESAPATPKQNRFASFIRDHQMTGSTSKPGNLSRRNTFSDLSDTENRNAGVSEDEGRDRIRAAWRRGIEGARGLSYSVRKTTQDPEAPGTEPRRPGAMRRLTGLDGNSSPFRMRADRHGSTTAMRWKQIMAGIKALGQRNRDERMRVDYQKSAQLMSELLAGVPAAILVASMYQRDEHGHRKVPVLLEQLQARIPESDTRQDSHGDRHLVFRIDLEYGNGPTRMQWSIRRSLQDFLNLHLKYKGQIAADKVRHLRSDDRSKAKMPRFPKSAFPYARAARGLFDILDDEEEEEPENNAPAEVDHTQTSGTSRDVSAERPMRTHKRRQSSFAPPRRTSTGGEASTGQPDKMEQYQQRQRQKLETYLQQMIRWLIFRPDSTRLCKFLEISALAIRLSGEGGYIGKQGLLSIASRQNREGRRRRILLGVAKEAAGGFQEKRRPRWFLVRQSYIVCVEGPESLVPYDVFLVDSDFRTEKRIKQISDQKTPAEMAKAAADGTKAGKHHLVRLYNAERKLKLIARSERQYLQFQESLNTMMQATIWARKQRFGSYAPVRHNVWARWLVDGRDHMWQVSRAIDNAKDFIYIHDWWLSPELYLRRPAAISQKWRLDRLLQRKAQEGVKIFVIVYRNIESAIPIDSEYTKWSLLDLHENICVQRSPNQFRQNQFFWAHHEKLVVVDNMMAFVGGVDLCFGRWDDPCHSLTDDKLTGFELDTDVPRDSEHCQVWPGKDYSNPRVQDFYALDRPYEEMYDRTKVPRMPWHDIAMQIVGQPARDVGRHFVQRWNYILRSRIPSRPTPVLLPPPEYEHEELERLGMTGTCQIQILRSCSSWSIGTPNKIEHSIMNAYCHLISTSEHFVYIENQFFITSTIVEGTPIHNKIGDALVERATRAFENNERWQACIVIPLMPGFQNSVENQDGTSVRLIMQCQFRSICRGEHSIFGRLRAKGIDPEDYIRFYSLRQWGRIGPRKCLTTEQLYIHAKCMIVDDRTAIIGSANINERSMLGSRDSEVAAIVTDTKMLPSFMGGQPYEVGEFPHTLRKRLMREHLGIDVDAIYRREQANREREEQDKEMARIYRDDFDGPSDRSDGFATPAQSPTALTEQNLGFADALGSKERERQGGHASHGWCGTTQASSDTSDSSDGPFDPEQAKADSKKEREREMDVEGYGPDHMKDLERAGDVGLTDSFVDAQNRETLLKKDAPDSKRIRSLERDAAKQISEVPESKVTPPIRPPWPMERLDTVVLGLAPRSQLPELPALDDTDIGGPPLIHRLSQTSAKAINPLIQTMRRPEVHEDCMTDPLALGFYHDIWHTVAENNTRLYRQVFRCMPDSEVLDWKAYDRFNKYNDRFMLAQGLGVSKPETPEAPNRAGPPGSGSTDMASAVTSSAVKGPEREMRNRSKSVLSTVVGKFRSGSKTDELTHTEETHEKKRPSERKAAPGSPGSEASSDPTAVATPDVLPLDEKEAAKQADPGISEKDFAPEGDVVLGQAKIQRHPNGMPSESEIFHGVDGAADEKKPELKDDGLNATISRQRTVQYSEDVNNAPETTATQSTTLQHSTSKKGRRRGTTKSSARPFPEEVLSKEEAEELLKMVQGHLVLWPYDWYVSESNLSMQWKAPLTCETGSRGKKGEAIGCTVSTSWPRWKFTTRVIFAWRQWLSLCILPLVSTMPGFFWIGDNSSKALGTCFT